MGVHFVICTYVHYMQRSPNSARETSCPRKSETKCLFEKIIIIIWRIASFKGSYCCCCCCSSGRKDTYIHSVWLWFSLVIFKASSCVGWLGKEVVKKNKQTTLSIFEGRSYLQSSEFFSWEENSFLILNAPTFSSKYITKDIKDMFKVLTT